MKPLLLSCLFFIATLTTVNAQVPANDLSIFLGKLQKYTATYDIYLEPKMPIVTPDGPPSAMPSPEVTGYMEDQETRLRYYSKYEKIVDPETRYSFHVPTGKIALEPIRKKETASKK